LKLRLNFEVGDWPINIIDRFSPGYSNFQFGSVENYGILLGSQSEAESDALGRFVFRTPAEPARTELNAADPALRYGDADASFYVNSIVASTNHLMTNAVRVQASIYQDNLWYNQGRRGLPDLRQGAIVTISDEREELRFKPFITYEAERSSYDQAFGQRLYLGLRGPIDDQISLLAQAGLFFDQARDLTTVLWDLRLHHDAGPFTSEDLVFGRDLTYFDDSLETFAFYQINQVLGPRLTGRAFLVYSEDQDLLGQYGETDAWRTGLSLDCRLGPKTHAVGQLFYNHFHGADDAESWIARLTLDYQWTDTFRVNLIYQYQKYDAFRASVFGTSYFENLVVLRLTKSFH